MDDGSGVHSHEAQYHSCRCVRRQKEVKRADRGCQRETAVPPVTHCIPKRVPLIDSK